MKKNDMMIILVGVIWAIIILLTIMVSRNWNVVDWVLRPIITEILLIEFGGAIGSIVVLWMGSSPSEETVSQ